jgi:hypothetical protein
LSHREASGPPADWVVRVATLFDWRMCSLLPLLGRIRNASSAKPESHTSTAAPVVTRAESPSGSRNPVGPPRQIARFEAVVEHQLRGRSEEHAVDPEAIQGPVVHSDELRSWPRPVVGR